MTEKTDKERITASLRKDISDSSLRLNSHGSAESAETLFPISKKLLRDRTSCQNGGGRIISRFIIARSSFMIREHVQRKMQRTRAFKRDYWHFY
ncbi:hypothetical protein PUN28_005082 [Cardiocondyla obscurior]|uniref:Ribosomal protein S14 n=1 Tax=Cardiocondyla obscurior TaxID=286306 RepID=A0AAW2GFR9_9HYME